MDPANDLPIDFHCHGVDSFDFTDIHSINLIDIEKYLSVKQQRSILTLYLPKFRFEDFINFIDEFHQSKKRGNYSHILGVGLEGPLLASHGGTPDVGVWAPERMHWEQLAKCGKKGLIYIILSPDAYINESNFSNVPNNNSLPSMSWIVETLLEGGVLPSPGHFTKNNPNASAKKLKEMLQIVKDWGHCPILTDHFLNDMPHNFKHAWRTKKEKHQRLLDINEININAWNQSNIEEKLGIIPAMIVEHALQGTLKVCQNFDGEHVDLLIVKKLVELIQAQNIILMTDSIESRFLAGRKLHQEEGSTLLYQDNGIVAVGSCQLNTQIENMFQVGLLSEQIKLITNIVPSELLNKRNEYIKLISHDKISYI